MVSSFMAWMANISAQNSKACFIPCLLSRPGCLAWSRFVTPHTGNRFMQNNLQSAMVPTERTSPHEAALVLRPVGAMGYHYSVQSVEPCKSIPSIRVMTATREGLSGKRNGLHLDLSSDLCGHTRLRCTIHRIGSRC